MMEQTNPYQAPSADVSAVPTGVGYDETGPLSPQGRFGRLSYLAWGMVAGVIAYIVMIAFGGSMMLTQDMAHPRVGMLLLPQLVMSVVFVLFIIRRLHDFDATGWWTVLLFVPLVNVIFALVLILKAGTAGANRYGPPRLTRGWEMVLGYIAIGFWALGIIGIFAAVLIPLFAR